MKFLPFFILLFFFIGNNAVYCQDIHFSQYYTSPLSLNPAETGLILKDFRFTNNYRNQWNAVGIPYKTISASVDVPIKFENKSALGIGIIFINDFSGGTSLKINKLAISASYIKEIKKQKLSFGVQTAYITKNFTLSDITLPSQYNNESGYFDVDMPNGISNNNTNLRYIDVNIGISYFGKIKKMRPYAGISVFHINHPLETFYNNNSRLTPKTIISGGIKIHSKNFNVNPCLMLSWSKKNKEIYLGSLFYYNNTKSKIFDSVMLGLNTRTSLNNLDAIIGTFGIGIYKMLYIATSYDLNISKLSQATNLHGAFEFSVIYEMPFSKEYKTTIPCNRF